MGEKKLFGADMRITGLGIIAVEDSAGEARHKLRLSRLETDHFEGQVGSLSYRADELSIDALQTTLGREQTTAESVDLGSLSATSDDDNIEITTHRVGCPRGLLFTSGEELFAPHVSIEDAHIVIHDLGKLYTSPGRPDHSTKPNPAGQLANRDGQAGPDKAVGGEATGAAVARQASQMATGADPAQADGSTPPEHPLGDRQSGDDDSIDAESSDEQFDADEPGFGETDDEERIDWHCLDVLEGRLDLDLILDMTLPWVGRRRATHYFRVPIEDGTIDYDKLEDDVHWLEAAFLKIELIDDKLVLARDLPLVPYSGEPLLSWPLEEEDISMAAYRRVHLRNLLRPRRVGKPNKDGDKDKAKSRLALHALALENVKISLHAKAPAQIDLPGGALIQIGDDEQPGLVNLHMAGAVHYEAGQDTKATALSGQIERLDLTVKDLPFGPAQVSADRLHISEIDKVELSFDGLRPRRLELWASRLAATHLRIQFR
ncbi:MAG: hypothetical protein MJE77_04875 [Proteobacteria bacterium]|nr:hypothetical protein [Pseudomonadota bacterium]